MKGKDPIKALESLRDWNQECADVLFTPLTMKWPEMYELMTSIGNHFVTNQKVLNDIITEMKKTKKK